MNAFQAAQGFLFAALLAAGLSFSALAAAAQDTSEATGGQAEARAYWLANPAAFRAVAPVISAEQTASALADGTSEGPATLPGAARRAGGSSTAANADENHAGEPGARAYYLNNHDRFASETPPLTSAQKDAANDRGYLEGPPPWLNPARPTAAGQVRRH